MSSPYALAAVTAVLRARLTISLAASGVPSSVGGVSVTALTPDRIATGAQEGNSINLFLHHVSRNQGWANLGPPPRSEGGDLVANVPLGVDLHYVVSAYGQDPLTAEILLGHVVTAFHDEPVLTRGAIQRALSPNPPDPSVPAALGSSRLADQVESLRVTATTPGTEEVARVWAAFQAPYRPSVFYDVSVVLLDGMARATSAFPVRMVGVGTTDVATPEIDDVVAQGPPGAPIDVDATVVVTGSALAGPGVRVRLGGSSAEPDVDGTRTLVVAVADLLPPARAGLHGLVVTHSVDLGDPPVPHPSASSSAFPVALRPLVTFGGGAVQVASTGTVDGVAVSSGTITVGTRPDLGRDQQAVLLLAEVAPPADRPRRGATLHAPAANGVPDGADSVASVAFPFDSVPRGAYVARLRVNGVESMVTVANDGRINGPTVTL